MDKNLPEPNQRIRDIIQEKAGGNVLRFASMINEGRLEPISQQKLNRLFNIDTRTEKFPSVPHDVLEAILMKFEDVDAKWLVTGSKAMALAEEDVAYGKPSPGKMTVDLLTLRNQIGSALSNLQEAMQTLGEPFGPETSAAGDPAFRQPGKKKKI